MILDSLTRQRVGLELDVLNEGDVNSHVSSGVMDKKH